MQVIGELLNEIVKSTGAKHVILLIGNAGEKADHMFIRGKPTLEEANDLLTLGIYKVCETDIKRKMEKQLHEKT